LRPKRGIDLQQPTAKHKKMLKICVSMMLNLASLACTGRKPEVTKAPDKVPPRQAAPGTGEAQRASAVIVITENEVKKAAAKESLDPKDIQYRATFQDIVVGSGPVTFENGKAVITLTDLQANQFGNLKIEILTGDQPKLTAEASDIRLAPAKVTPVEVTLEAVDITSTGRTGTGTGTNTGTGTSAGVTPTNPNSLSPGVSPAPPNQGNSPAPALWDGKSDRGNKMWQIVPDK